MNMPMLQAYIEGYQERLFDRQCLAVHQGFWAGYYQSKKPKSIKTVLTQLIRDHEKQKLKEKNIEVKKPEVDVEAFLEQERRLKASLQKG